MDILTTTLSSMETNGPESQAVNAISKTLETTTKSSQLIIDSMTTDSNIIDVTSAKTINPTTTIQTIFDLITSLSTTTASPPSASEEVITTTTTATTESQFLIKTTTTINPLLSSLLVDTPTTTMASSSMIPTSTAISSTTTAIISSISTLDPNSTEILNEIDVNDKTAVHIGLLEELKENFTNIVTNVKEIGEDLQNKTTDLFKNAPDAIQGLLPQGAQNMSAFGGGLLSGLAPAGDGGEAGEPNLNVGYIAVGIFLLIAIIAVIVYGVYYYKFKNGGNNNNNNNNNNARRNTSNGTSNGGEQQRQDIQGKVQTVVHDVERAVNSVKDVAAGANLQSLVSKHLSSYEKKDEPKDQTQDNDDVEEPDEQTAQKRRRQQPQDRTNPQELKEL